MPPRPAYVAFAQIGFADGTMRPRDLGSALEEALTPGKQVVRYNRRWRLPRHERKGDWITGRLGFEHPGNEAAVWDDQKKDYRDVNAAHLTRYMIEAKSGRIAFELKSSTIKPWTFQGNFQALLNLDSHYQWRVTLEGIDQPSWEEWEGSVDRITSIRIRLEPPNPRYRGDAVKDLIEGAKLTAATIVASGDDIDLSDSEVLQEAIQHAKAGYGTIKAKGVEPPDGEKVEWRSDEEAQIVREPAERDPETREVPPAELRRLLKEQEG